MVELAAEFCDGHIVLPCGWEEKFWWLIGLVAGFAGCSFWEDGFGGGGDFTRGFLFLFGKDCWDLFRLFRVV